MTAEYVEVMSVRVGAGSRTLYIDVKQNPDESRFVTISEVKRGGEARSRILIDEQYLPDLSHALNAVAEFLAPKAPGKGRTVAAPKAPGKGRTVAEKRRTHPHAYEPWTDKEDQRLGAEFAQGLTIDQLAQAYGRTATAIRTRLERLGLTRNRP